MPGFTPVYGIQYPVTTDKARDLPLLYQQQALTTEAALHNANIPPIQPMSIVVAATAGARDAHWGIPATEAARITLQNKGAQTVRTDMGWTEQYFATWNATTNPEGARVPGWYPISGHMPGGRVMRSAATVNLGNNVWQLLNLSTYWKTSLTAHGIPTFNGSWTIPMDGVYLIEASVKCDTAVNTILAVKRNDAASSFANAILGVAGYGFAGTALTSVSAEVPLKQGDILRLGYFTLAATTWNTTEPDLSYFGVSFARPVRAAI